MAWHFFDWVSGIAFVDGWVQWDAHHWDPLVQLGQWTDQARCCSPKAEAPILEKLYEKLKKK